MSYFPLTINFYVEYQHMTELSLIDHKAWNDIFFMFYIHRNHHWAVLFKHMFHNAWCCNKLVVPL